LHSLTSPPPLWRSSFPLDVRLDSLAPPPWRRPFSDLFLCATLPKEISPGVFFFFCFTLEPRFSPLDRQFLFPKIALFPFYLSLEPVMPFWSAGRASTQPRIRRIFLSTRFRPVRRFCSLFDPERPPLFLYPFPGYSSTWWRAAPGVPPPPFKNLWQLALFFISSLYDSTGPVLEKMDFRLPFAPWAFFLLSQGSLFLSFLPPRPIFFGL